MPELPEVETVARAFHRIASDRRIKNVEFFRRDLRWVMPQAGIKRVLCGHRVSRVFRRGKYLLVETKQGFGIIHLGMSGRLVFSNSSDVLQPHTHFMIELERADLDQPFIHFIDPRRFGVFDVSEKKDWRKHKLLNSLGLEPLETEDLGERLWLESRGRSSSIKAFIMNAKVVVGVGNIYACEALFRAGIDPRRAAGRTSRKRYVALGHAIQEVLRHAIASGGTTLRDYQNMDGEFGSFAVELFVYGRSGMNCLQCQKLLRHVNQHGRSSWFCAFCQK